MEGQHRASLHEFVRAHRVHYDLEIEQADDGSHRQLVGARVRLLAAHDGAHLGTPGCRECSELLTELRSLADAVAADAGVAERVEIVPVPRKLYQSSDEPNTDEVALAVRIHCDAPEHRPSGPGEDPCVSDLRERLSQLGVTRH